MINNRTEFVFRRSILAMLSDDEVASVSTSEAATCLSEGEEYVDLEQPARGVCLAAGLAVPPGSVLSRRAVLETTWSNVLTQLEAYRVATRHFGVGRGTVAAQTASPRCSSARR